MEEQLMRYRRLQAPLAKNHFVSFFKSSIILVASLLTINLSTGFAEDSAIAQFSVIEPWARPTTGSINKTAVYLTIKNSGKQDTLQRVSSSITDSGELHTTKNQDGMLMMEKVKQGLLVQENQTLMFSPRGMHIMLTELTQPLKIGQEFVLSLHFQNAGLLDIIIPVRQRTPANMGDAHSHE